jgi:hypothetical protein
MIRPLVKLGSNSTFCVLTKMATTVIIELGRDIHLIHLHIRYEDFIHTRSGTRERVLDRRMESTNIHDVSSPQRKIQFLPLSAGQIGVRLIPILCLFSNQLFT